MSGHRRAGSREGRAGRATPPTRPWISEYRPDVGAPTPPGSSSGTAGRPRNPVWSAPAAVQFALCTAAVIIGLAALHPFFGQWSFLGPVAIAATAGTACGAMTLILRRPPALAWLLTAVGFVALCIFVLFPGTTRSGVPTLASLTAVTDGLRHGLARMLTIAPPADVEPQLLVVPVTVAFLACAVSAVLVPRPVVLLPLLPPLLTFIAALLLGANAAAFQWQVTAAFLGCCFAVALLRAGRVGTASTADPGAGYPGAGEAASGRRLLGPGTVGAMALGVPLLVLVVAGATAAAGLLPVANGASRFDPRELRPPPLVLQDQLNPLVDLRRQIETPDGVSAFTIRTAGGTALPVDRIRVAALDDYSGVQFTSGSVFVRTGSTLPAGIALADPATTTVEVTLTGAMTPNFLPGFGVPQRVVAENLGYDKATGLLVTGERQLQDYHYQLTVQQPAVPPDPATATAAAGPEYDRWRQLPQGLAGEPGVALAGLARDVVAGGGTDIERLQRIADQLKSWPYAPDAAPGHSYGALQRFLPDAPPSSDQRVTEEQTVAAFVIMARSLGYPARVAVGYRIDPASAVDGLYTVQVNDADAWAEVAFAGQGWVPFSPTAPREGQPPPAPPAPPVGDQGLPEPVDPGTTGPDVALPGPGGVALGWALVLTILIPLLIIGAAVGAVVAAKQWRRRRRSTRGNTAQRIIGAWRESTSRLRESGFAVPPAMTPSEVGRRAGERFGDEAGASVRSLSPLVSAAVYAPEPPDEDAVVRAWDLEAELRSILDGRRSFLQRLLVWVDPRPLLPGRRDRRPAEDPRSS